MSRINKRKPVFQRIIDNVKIDQVTKCWNWTGKLTSCYGHINVNAKMEYVHRVMYKIFYGKIPEDKPFVLHDCDNPKCCNPLHLYAGTQKDNIQDMIKRNRCNDRFYRGEKNGNAKLTEKQVLEIRASQESQVTMAKRFNVSRGTINRIKHQKSWQHIK